MSLIITTGEPAGIGPDICVQLADYLASVPVVLCGDIDVLNARAKLLGYDVAFYDSNHKPPVTSLATIPVHHTPCFAEPRPGFLDVRNSPYVMSTLTLAAELTVSKKYSGIVTAPLHKGIMCEMGEHFSGHTEFFAQHTQSSLPVMVLGTSELKVALVTTHLPLKEISATITPSLLAEVLTIVNDDMKRYFTNGRNPRIGVCGLNPHAGEDGHMGDEEITVINPTLEQLRTQGLDVSNALPADTLFVPHHAAHYDIIVAMYHDQGLPVVKSQGFGDCVNMTFGLPIVRTSVDHGTALDLAGTGKANPNSLKCAVEMALQMTGEH